MGLRIVRIKSLIAVIITNSVYRRNKCSNFKSRKSQKQQRNASYQYLQQDIVTRPAGTFAMCLFAGLQPMNVAAVSDDKQRVARD